MQQLTTTRSRVYAAVITFGLYPAFGKAQELPTLIPLPANQTGASIAQQAPAAPRWSSMDDVFDFWKKMHQAEMDHAARQLEPLGSAVHDLNRFRQMDNIPNGVLVPARHSRGLMKAFGLPLDATINGIDIAYGTNPHVLIDTPFRQDVDELFSDGLSILDLSSKLITHPQSFKPVSCEGGLGLTVVPNAQWQQRINQRQVHELWQDNIRIADSCYWRSRYQADVQRASFGANDPMAIIMDRRAQRAKESKDMAIEMMNPERYYFDNRTYRLMELTRDGPKEADPYYRRDAQRSEQGRFSPWLKFANFFIGRGEFRVSDTDGREYFLDRWNWEGGK